MSHMISQHFLSLSSLSHALGQRITMKTSQQDRGVENHRVVALKVCELLQAAGEKVDIVPCSVSTSREECVLMMRSVLSSLCACTRSRSSRPSWSSLGDSMYSTSVLSTC